VKAHSNICLHFRGRQQTGRGGAGPRGICHHAGNAEPKPKCSKIAIFFDKLTVFASLWKILHLT